MRIPFIHITDLYHPPQDPDDHFDLATVAALTELDLRGIILDATRKFLDGPPHGYDIPRDPGLVPVMQLCYILGRAIPVAVGPTEPLRHPGDTARDRLPSEQAGIELLLDLLRASDEPFVISVVGSTRVVAAAFNRDPILMRQKTKAVLLNAGATAVTRDEWNVNLDLSAYVDLWRSGLPIHWYPCATERGAFDEEHQHATHWKATHQTLLRDLPPRLRAWFSYAFAGNARGDIVRALDEQGIGAVWEHVLSAERNMWSTASLIMAAGRELTRTSEGWRFVPRDDRHDPESWPLFLDPIAAAVSDDGQVDWKPASGPAIHRLFRRHQPGREYGRAMAEALNALLRSMKC